jgi:hypothetical protein
MAEKLDVAGRLAEGRQAVDNVQDYVWASHLVGYHHPDLTLHAAQIRDWYASEDGLDLRALDSDCAALQAVIAATEGALRLQDDQDATLTGAWWGGGADASREFLRRHHEASAAASAAVRTAAAALSSLRDNLWQMVDGKVAAAVAIDDRRQAERADWLAAAHTVTKGAGDRAVASELIDQQVKAFVDNDIRADWLTAMRTTIAAVAASYDAATAGLTAEPAAVFGVPGDLGPSWTPPPSTAPATDEPARSGGATAPAAAVAPVPAAWSSPPVANTMPPPAPPPPPMPPAPALEPPPMAPAPPPAPAMPAAPVGELGNGLSGVGQGLSGFGQQLADALGGLLNPADDALPDPPGEAAAEPDAELKAEPGDDEAEPEDDAEPDDKARPEDDTEEPAAVDEAVGEGEDGCDAAPVDEPPGAPVDEPPTEPVEEPPAEPVEDPPAEAAATPTPMPPPPAPMPVTEPPPDPQGPGATPCEIAADELPQAGE